MKVIWTEGAIEDLHQAFEYLGRSSGDAASRLVEALLNRAASLQSMPFRGRKRSTDGAYEMYIAPWSYVILYEVIGEGIYIEGIVHSARDRRL